MIPDTVGMPQALLENGVRCQCVVKIIDDRGIERPEIVRVGVMEKTLKSSDTIVGNDERVHARIGAPLEAIASFCKRWDVTELALFGSVLRDDFRPDSDIDVLASFGPGCRHTLFDILRMQDELGGLFGREVDLIERAWVEQGRNYIRRKAILSSAETIYAG